MEAKQQRAAKCKAIALLAGSVLAQERFFEVLAELPVQDCQRLAY